MKNVASKWARALAVMVVALLGTSMVPGMVFDSPVTENTAAAEGETYVKIGWLSEVINWNPMDIAMVEDWVTCFLVFSTLWRFDENWGEPVEDLVTSWNTTYYGDGTMTLWINITENAYFRNEAQTGIDSTEYPLTADDVVFTLDMAKSRTSTAWEFYLRDYENITAVDDHTVRMDIPYYKAVLIEDLCGIPIVPQFQWQPWVDDKTFMQSMDPDELIGSSMFVYEDHLTGSWYMFKRAPNYHGEADYGAERTVSVDGVLYDLSTSDLDMIFSANAGEIDAVAVTGSATLFLEELGVGTDEPIVKSVVQEPGICDIALNAIPMQYRYDGSGANDYGLGSPHLLDKEVRKAILMTLDKDYINNTIMGGLAVKGTSVIPPGSWQADIEGVLPFDTDGAKQVLLDAGYIDDGGEFLIATEESYVRTENLIPAGDPALRLEHIRCHAPSTDTSYVDITMAWAGWAEDAGIGFDAGPINEAQMINDEWYKALFDIWVWHWGWGPEPLGNLCVWLTSEMHVGGDNCEMPMGPWWVNSTNYTTSPYVDASMIEEFDMDSDDFIGFSAFDQNFSLAQKTVDVGERQVLVKKLQQWVYDSYTESPPYYDVGLYGFSTARFQGWGNWELHSGRTVISSLPWLWFDLEPTGVPMFDTGLAASYEAQQDDPTSFSVMIHDSDGDPLDVTWSFGDGSLDVTDPYTTGTAASFEASVTHTYTTLETGLTLTVTVSDGTNTIEDSASVDVVAVADEIPEISNPSHSPPVAYIGDTTTWSITASDAEATELMVTWEWDDGSFTSTLIPIGTPGTPVTDEKTHVFDSPGTYDVTVHVDDGSPLGGHNNSLVVAPAYSVIANTPPLAPDIDDYATNVGVLTSLSATSSDADPDALRFTWEWDDDTFDVTNHPSDPGATIVSDVEHSWSAAGTYPVTVWVDDLTGEDGHNVSTTIDVVVTIPPQQPANIQLVANPSPALEDQPVGMTASATDGNGDALIITIDFGDGGALYSETTAGGVTTPQSISTTHAYTDANTYTVTVYADDGTTNVSKGFTLVVNANSPPLAPDIDDYATNVGVLTSLSATSSDADPDALRFTWEWDDDTFDVTNHPSDPGATIVSDVEHSWSAAGTYPVTVWVDDLTGEDGHNVSTTIDVVVTVSAQPPANIQLIANPSPALEDQPVGMTASATDGNGDALIITIDFGDGGALYSETTAGGVTTPQSISTTHAYTDANTYTVTVYADDGTTNVSKGFTLVVNANSPPLAPDIDDYATNVGVLTSLSATSSDANPDALRFTWEWDDDTFDVTNHPSDPGATIVSDVEHTWDTLGTYPVTVWVDDLTGEDGHNVSTTIDVVVMVGPIPPSGIQLIANPSPALEDQPVGMTASATDGNGDALIITIDFGDGGALYSETTAGGVTTPQSISTTHAYTDANTYTVTVYADDGTTNVSKGFTLVVNANSPPLAPDIDDYATNVGVLTSLSATSSDANPDALRFTWEWDDDTFDVTNHPSDPGATIVSDVEHTWGAAGTYPVTVWVDDLTGEDGHNVSTTIDVVVTVSAQPPANIQLVANPSPALEDQPVGMTASATDGNGDALIIIIDFGDGESYDETTAGGVTTPQSISTTHAYTDANTYTVTVYADDGTTNVSKGFTLVVNANSPPLAPDIDDYATNVGVLTSLSATSSDANPDALRFTWEWDDDTFDVTNHPSDPGATIVSDVEHTWSVAGTYTVTVWVDDLTGEDGHNVSTTIDVVVTVSAQPPANIQLVANPSPALEDQPVWMEASATDGNGDALIITIDFGDGESYDETTVGGTTGPQFITVSHTYADADTYTVTVSADDGTTIVSKGFTLVVNANSPPYIQLVGSYSAMYNETFTVTPIDVSDADDDDLTVWYDWGDGSPMTEGTPSIGYAASHEYHEAAVFTLKAYVDDNTGVMGHNVSTTATVTVGANLRPAIVDGAHSADNYTVGSEITFTVIVKDPEGDPMVVKIIFGDTQDVTQEAVTPTGNEEITVTMTHTYTTSGEFEVSITVEDDKDHVNPQWNDKPMTLTINPAPSEDDDEGGGSNIYYIVGGALLAIIVIAAVAMMMKKRKGKDSAAQDTGAGGGMEGMQPPEGPPPA